MSTAVRIPRQRQLTAQELAERLVSMRLSVEQLAIAVERLNKLLK